MYLNKERGRRRGETETPIEKRERVEAEKFREGGEMRNFDDDYDGTEIISVREIIRTELRG